MYVCMFSFAEVKYFVKICLFLSALFSSIVRAASFGVRRTKEDSEASRGTRWENPEIRQGFVHEFLRIFPLDWWSLVTSRQGRRRGWGNDGEARLFR